MEDEEPDDAEGVVGSGKIDPTDRELESCQSDSVRDENRRQGIEHLVGPTESDLSTTRLPELPCERSSEKEIGELKGRRKVRISKVDASFVVEEKKGRGLTAEVQRFTESMMAYQSRIPSGISPPDHCLA